MKDLNDDSYCFACGTKNVQGLQLVFTYDEEEDRMKTTVNLPRRFQGWRTVLHGGILATVMDEIMVKAVEHKGKQCVTAELNIKFKQPALTETDYVAYGKIVRDRGRIMLGEASIVDADNKPVALAEGKFFIHERK
ncbi:MAG: PaaI family thioesterase [bacterium]|nr:PaaI family thioesterase [bacterium]